MNEAMAEISPMATHTPLAMVTRAARMTTMMRTVPMAYVSLLRLIACPMK